MATIKDVARRAQVSTATVSYVLNGTGVVSEATRARVLAAVAELGYQPNHSARALRTRSHTIGVVAPGIAGRLADPGTAEMLAGLSEAATAAGYCLLIAAPTATESEEELALRLVRSGRVDGLVIVDLRRDDERPSLLAEAGVPMIAIGAPTPGIACPVVGFDLRTGAEQASHHLIRLGHRRIALINFPSDLSISEPFYTGYLNALHAAGLRRDAALVIEAGSSETDGVAAMQELLTLRHPPTAVLAASDTLAFGAMHAIRDASLTVGVHISVVGCDDLPLAAHTYPSLTTLRAPRRELGTTLAHHLIGQIERRNAPAVTLLPLRLIIRHSTAAPFRVSG
ncbi:MAG: LacI family DNA-binding transcriptional regulator [Chloroflexus sp.]|nr:LacI family DNA-binding transcriptional regulator [Chloroflexus sp.]